jgi:hypothetical protein
MSCPIIENISNDLWEEMGSPTNLSASSIETKLLSSGYIGNFDILVNGCHYLDYDYSISGYCITPTLSSDEQSIYYQLYLTDYYKRRINEVLTLNNGSTSTMWTNIKEGDSSITRSNPVDMAKVLKDSYVESKKSLEKLIDDYKKNSSNSVSIDYLNIEQYGHSPNNQNYRSGP